MKKQTEILSHEVKNDERSHMEAVDTDVVSDIMEEIYTDNHHPLELAMHSITQTGQRPSKLTMTPQLHLGSACDVHTRSPAAVSGSRAPPVSLAGRAGVAPLKSEAY